MAISRPFAYNPGSILSGTEQYGTIAVGTGDNPYSENYGGLQWWQGPDEDLGYCIGTSVPSGDQPTPLGNIGTVQFWRTDSFDDNQFISLSNTLSNQNFSSSIEAVTWLNDNGYWSSYAGISPSPTPTNTPTPTVTETPSITPTTSQSVSSITLSFNYSLGSGFINWCNKTLEQLSEATCDAVAASYQVKNFIGTEISIGTQFIGVGAYGQCWVTNTNYPSQNLWFLGDTQYIIETNNSGVVTRYESFVVCTPPTPTPTTTHTPTNTPTPTSTLTPTPSVTPGGTELLVYLDSGNPSSYPGTGSTWTDLEGGDDNATLFNSPTFSSSYQGILQFDDVSLEYATIPDLGNLPEWTVEAWFRLTSPLTGKVTSVITNEFDLVDKLNFSMGTNNAPTNTNLSVGFFDGDWHTTTGVVPQVGVWYQVVGTYDGSVVRQYVNGVASGGTVNYVGTPESGGEVRLMRRWDLTAIASNLVDGDLAIVKIYNGAISDSEVLSSYNSTYTRFLDITPTATNTPTVTPTNTATSTETQTPTPTPEVSPTPTPSVTPTITPTITPTTQI